MLGEQRNADARAHYERLLPDLEGKLGEFVPERVHRVVAQSGDLPATLLFDGQRLAEPVVAVFGCTAAALGATLDLAQELGGLVEQRHVGRRPALLAVAGRAMQDLDVALRERPPSRGADEHP